MASSVKSGSLGEGSTLRVLPLDPGARVPEEEVFRVLGEGDILVLPESEERLCVLFSLILTGRACRSCFTGMSLVVVEVPDLRGFSFE